MNKVHCHRNGVLAFVLYLSLLLTAQGKASACDLAHAFSIAATAPKSSEIKTIEAEERRSTDQGFWNIHLSGKGIVSLEREDNNEWGEVRTLYVKIDGGYAITVRAEKISVPGIDEETTTTDYFVQCEDRIYYGMPLSPLLHETSSAEGAHAYAKELLAVLKRAKELAPYAPKMLTQ